MPVYHQAIQNKADTDKSHAELGEILVSLGDLPAAANAMETAAEMNLSNLQNLTESGNALSSDGPRSRRRAEPSKAILAQNPKHAQAYNVYGTFEIQRGQGTAARGYFEKAVEYDQELTEPYLNLGLLAQQAGQSQLAIGYYKKFLERAHCRKSMVSTFLKSEPRLPNLAVSCDCWQRFPRWAGTPEACEWFTVKPFDEL